MPDSTSIHASALISSQAEISEGVQIGPFAVIEGPVKIAAGCQILAHAQLVGDVELGENCVVGRGVIIGEEPQDLSFDSTTKSGVRIGSGNIFRELVTIHRSAREGEFTRVGDRNFLMAGAHLAHDVEIGNDNVIANNCLLAGHVKLGEHAFLGGGTVVHQFIRLGDFCLTQGNSAISKDVPPYVTACKLNRFGGVNVIGLRRAGFDSDLRREIQKVIDELFRSGKPLRQAVSEARSERWSEHAEKIIEFVAAESRKGVLTAARRA